MGDKNNIVEVTTTDVLAKTGHSVLKAIYVTESGDNTWIIRDGVAVGGVALFTIDNNAITNGPILMPYINHPMRDGIYIDHTGGTTGRLLVVYE